MMALSPISSQIPQATATKKQAQARAGEAFQPPTTEQYTPLPVIGTTQMDAFTPSAATNATLAPLTAAMPVDGTTTLSSTTDAPIPPSKPLFDPIAGAVGVAGILLTTGILTLATKGEKGEWQKELPKLLLGAGVGVGAALLAPLGGNLIKDLLKKKPAAPAEPQPEVATTTATPPALPEVVASPQVVDGLVTGVPPAIDPMTGLPLDPGAISSLPSAFIA